MTNDFSDDPSHAGACENDAGSDRVLLEGPHSRRKEIWLVICRHTSYNPPHTRARHRRVK